MVVKRTNPRYPRRGPSCLLLLFVILGVAVGTFIISNAEEVRETIIPTPTPEPTRSATEYALLADLSEKDGEYEKAIQYYETAVRLDGTKPEIYIRLINLLVLTGQPERALEVADQVTVLAPDNEDVWTAVAAAYIANGDRLEAAGDVSGGKLQYAEAVQAATKATGINPNNGTAYAYIAGGLVLQEDPERYEEAQEAANTAVLLEPDNPLARLYMATVFTYQGYYKAAREQWLLGIDADPANPDLYIGLAYNFFGDGKVTDAILSFQNAIDVDPDNAVAYDGLAYMYLQLGDEPSAVKNATEAIRLDPNTARHYGRLGEAYFKQNNYPEAIKALETAVAMYGEATDLNARFFYMLAAAYIRSDLNLCPQAVPLFEQTLDAIAGIPGTLLEDGALKGLEECRRAVLESAP